MALMLHSTVAYSTYGARRQRGAGFSLRRATLWAIVALFAPGQALALGSATIRSGSLIAYMTDESGITRGTFHTGVATTGGVSSGASDDNVSLIQGYVPLDPGYQPSSTFDALLIDGRNAVAGHSANGPSRSPALIGPDTIEGDQIISASGILVRKRVTFSSDLTGAPNMARFTWILSNTSLADHNVGLRSVMDLAVGGDLGIPVIFPGDDPVDHIESERTGADVPAAWFVTGLAPDTAEFPGVVAGGILDGFGATRPDRVVASYSPFFSTGDWFGPYPRGFVYAGWNNPYADSAIGFWWNPSRLAPGESRRYSILYGQLPVESCLNGPRASLLLPPAYSVECGSGLISPVELPLIVPVAMDVNGPGDFNVIVTLVEGTGLSIIRGPNPVWLGDMAPGELRLVTWTLAANGAATGNAGLGVEIAGGSGTGCTLSGSVFIPPPASCTPDPGFTGTPTYTRPPGPTPSPTPTPRETSTRTPTRTPTSTHTLRPTDTPTSTPDSTSTPLQGTPTATPVPVPIDLEINAVYEESQLTVSIRLTMNGAATAPPVDIYTLMEAAGSFYSIPSFTPWIQPLVSGLVLTGPIDTGWGKLLLVKVEGPVPVPIELAFYAGAVDLRTGTLAGSVGQDGAYIQ